MFHIINSLSNIYVATTMFVTVSFSNILAGWFTDLSKVEDLTLKAALVIAVIFLIRTIKKLLGKLEEQQERFDKHIESTLSKNTEALNKLVEAQDNQTRYFENFVKTIMKRFLDTEK